MSRARVVVAVAVIVATVVASLVASRLFHHDSRVEKALGTLPEQTLVANFTDWTAVRDALGRDVTSRSAAAARSDLFTHAYDRDYTTTTVLGAFDEAMAPTYGWTVLDSEWEMYGQSKDGAVDVLRMPDGFDFTTADRTLSKLGYTGADDHGVRVADDQTLASIANGLTPQLTALALLPDQQLIVASDAAAYAGLTVATIKGGPSSVLDVDGVAPMAAALGDTSVSALVDIGSHACTAAGFQDADPGQQALARQRISAAGGITAIRGLTRSIDASGRLTVVIDFASAAEAEADLEPRAVLARGEAPDQGGTFDERFSIGRQDVTGEVVTLELEPRSKDTQLLRDLGRGGLLFASC